MRVGDIDRDSWTWTVRRQTIPGPGEGGVRQVVAVLWGTLTCAVTWSRPVRNQVLVGLVRTEQRAPAGGLVDEAAEGKRARTVPLIEEIRPMVARRLGRRALGCYPSLRWSDHRGGAAGCDARW